MAFKGQEFLGYQLPKLLEPKMNKGIALTLKQLEQLFSGLPLLNIDQLSSQIPLYIFKINRLPIPDAQRFLILERLRPTVDYLYDSIIKKIKGRSLYLSKEYREFEHLTRELITGMAMGYQRLLFNKAKQTPSMLNRRKYRLLAQRAMYYLGEQIRVSYLLSMTVPKGIWKDFNISYAFTLHFRLNKRKITDKFAYHQGNKGSIDTLYYRILLLAIVSPYSLRNGELDQIYFGFEPWLDDIQLTRKIDGHRYGHILNMQSDVGPVYADQIKLGDKSLLLDRRQLLNKIKVWLDSDIRPASVEKKGMSTKLLKHLISNLDVAKRGVRERLESESEQIEVIIGLHNIHVFLQHVRALIKHTAISADSVPKVTNTATADANNLWGRRLESSWDSHQFHDASDMRISYKTQNRLENRSEPSVRRHIFTIENKSKTSVCISCNSLHGNGLCIGELMIIRNRHAEIWTLGVVLWMNLSDKQLNVGLHLLSAKVDWVTVDKMGTSDDVFIDALLLGGNERGETILLTRAEFKTNDYLELNHQGKRSLIRLTDSIWHSDGFAQFNFIDRNDE